MDNIMSSEICKKCAECCKNHPFVELSKNEIKSLELLSGLHCDVFVNSKGKAVDGYFLQLKENGECFFLNENNGSYSCAVYEARPEICRNYPYNHKQQEVCDSNKEKFLGNNSG